MSKSTYTSKRPTYASAGSVDDGDKGTLGDKPREWRYTLGNKTVDAPPPSPPWSTTNGDVSARDGSASTWIGWFLPCMRMLYVYWGKPVHPRQTSNVTTLLFHFISGKTFWPSHHFFHNGLVALLGTKNIL